MRLINYNVALTFLFRVCDGIATGVWSSSVLSNYISLQGGDGDLATEKVGIAQAVQGTFLVAAAIPAAWLASHYRRDRILKVMGIIALLAIGTTAAALLHFTGSQQYLVLCGALALWGISQANAPVLDALFADSVATGKRTQLYTLLHIAYILSQGLGPATAALLFYLHGNEWSPERLQRVMLAGMALAVAPALLLLAFNDDAALGEESEGLLKVVGSGGKARAGGLRQPLLEDQHQAAAWGPDDERDLEGFDLPIHSPMTGQDLLAAMSPRSPLARSARESRSRRGSPGPRGSRTPVRASSPTSPTVHTSPGSGGDVATAEAGGGSSGIPAETAPPDPESFEIALSDDGATMYSGLSGRSTPRPSLFVDPSGPGQPLSPLGPSASASPSARQDAPDDLQPPAPLQVPPLAQTTDDGALSSANSTTQLRGSLPGLQAGLTSATTSLDAWLAPRGTSSRPSATNSGGASPVMSTVAEGEGDLAGGASLAAPDVDGAAEVVVIEPVAALATTENGGDGAEQHTIITVSASPSKLPLHVNPGVISRSSPVVEGPYSSASGGADAALAAASAALERIPLVPAPPPERSSSLSRTQRGSASPPTASRVSRAAAVQRELAGRVVCGCLSLGSIPFILATTDCIMGLASGMTIKFFPIFFRSEVALSPVAVNLMYCGVPLALSAASAAAQRQSACIGRVPTMVINRAVGIALLYWIALNAGLWDQALLMVPIYVVRTSIMNANYPLQRAILMDYVPKAQRAKWASLESVTSFGWSGSAALGGYLIRAFGFQFTFLITATVQLLGWACSMLLLPIVPLYDITIPTH